MITTNIITITLIPGGVGLAIKESVIIHNSLVSIIQNENREEVLCPCVTKMNFTTLDASKLKGKQLMVTYIFF